MTSGNTKNSALIHELIEKAEANLRMAKQLLASEEGDLINTGGSPSYNEMASGMNTMREGNQQIIEGVFDGQNMIGQGGKAYPIAANYASKSKLIPGDQLKLTITPNGSFLYKQIGPIERKRIKGILNYEDGQYQVLAEGKLYKVLLASVTYFKAEMGDEITLVIPEHEESEWGAIENVLPQN